ncbi:NEW3 domain-containing protein [Saccharicrinis sp. FJH2]|uniref:COG1470 family protein n=1 Tax=Saccharicrinis sp. FJH65 TaxID=3344659 RepID=UPI0035F4D632
MKIRTHHFVLISLLTLTLLTLPNTSIFAAGVELHTPFVRISVPPGESVDYTIDVKNSTGETQNIPLYVTGIPKSWTYSLKGGGFNLQELSLLPGQTRTVMLKVEIPQKVNKGTYKLNVVAKSYDVLHLQINVSTQGTYKTEFTTNQINMQGHAKSKFNFTTKLRNLTGEKQEYSFHASPPEGWNVIFKPNYKQATAVEVDPNSTSNVSVEINPPYNVQAGTYKIPVEASNRTTSASLELEVVITGSYDMNLSTPTGRLSDELTAGKEKRIELTVINTGTSTLKNVIFSASKPQNWDVKFEPDTLTAVVAGGNSKVVAIVKAYDKSIPGDYAVKFTARTKEVSSEATFRLMVKTPMLWGWLGILIILSVVAAIFILFRKYGRR